MKNIIFIDVDTERERPIIFSKPPEITRPENHEDAKKMILNDIICLSEAIATLISMADQNGYATKTDLIVGTVNTIYELLNDDKNTENEHKK
jgi:hypothetical protein